MEVAREFGTLRYPACSIAISDLKRGPEAEECSHSILNAVQNILNRLGRMLSRRQAVVLGSRGAIARHTLADLGRILGPDRVYGVDIEASGDMQEACMEVRTLEEVPKDVFYETDLMIGVIGKSILKQEMIEAMVIHGKKRYLFFASGSTKTVEFQDLENWIQGLMLAESPVVRDVPVRLSTSPVRDLQTGVLQGHRVDLSFDSPSITDKTLFLLGDLTPINFLYYGIPREIIDEVMTQLFTVCVGLNGHHREQRPLPPALLAVDHQIDMDANPLGAMSSDSS
jgi:hypothetical protein